MALADLLKLSDNLERLNDLRTHLAAVRVEALADYEAARDKWDRAATDEATGTGNASTTAQAEEAMAKAKKASDKAEAAVRGVDARIEEVTLGSARAKEDEAWAKSQRLAVQRAKKAERLASAAKDFAEAYEGLCRTTAELFDALPVKPDPDAALLWGLHIETAVRVELRRLGVEWTWQATYGVVNLPEFLPPFEATPQVIQRWREASRG